MAESMLFPTEKKQVATCWQTPLVHRTWGGLAALGWEVGWGKKLVAALLVRKERELGLWSNGKAPAWSLPRDEPLWEAWRSRSPRRPA